MSRNAIRTATLSLDIITPMLGVFGTIMNAYRVLGMKDVDVTYPQFYRALHFETITPDQRSLIEEAWERWRYLFLLPTVPASSDLTVNVENRDSVPDWHPEAEEEDEEEAEEAPTKRRSANRG